MSKVIKIKRGLDIGLVGEAAKEVVVPKPVATYAVSPGDFPGVTPKLLVKPDDEVKAGSPLFFDKDRPSVIFTSPVSGRVAEIKRGEKRKIRAIIIEAVQVQEYEVFPHGKTEKMSREEIVGTLLKSGLWPMIIQRPYGRIADPGTTPKGIFVSGFDSAPLAPDMNFILKDEAENLTAGFEALGKLTSGKVYLGLKAGTEGVLNTIENAEKVFFRGPHPAGNVGVQIHYLDPINKGDVVWTVDVQNVAIIGRLFRTGKVDMRRTVALTGSEILHPKYVSVITGAPLVQPVMAVEVKRLSTNERLRLIAGDVLSGKLSNADGYVDMYHNQITIIPEGDKYEFLGWIMSRFNKLSVSHSYFSWLFPKKKYDLDTNLNGGKRAFVVTGLFEKYFPMDIYPMYLIKACMAGDIDKMENLGIYEVLPEDFALCEFVDPSKTDIQQAIADGIELMIKEVG